MNTKQFLRTFIVCLLIAFSVLPAKAAEETHFSLWVGESVTLTSRDIDVPFGWDNVLVTGKLWSYVGDADEYLSMTTGQWPASNDVTLKKFFTGTKRVKCKVSYYFTRVRAGQVDYSDMKTQDQYFYIECNTVDVTLYPENMELTIGESRALQYKFSPSTSQPTATVSFTSSNPKVAEVDFAGNVYAVSTGSATITAKTNFATTATCQVKVSPIHATSIALNHDALTLYAGEKATLTATVMPGNATEKSVSWASSDDKVAKVSQKGEVTAVGTGRAQVTATTKDGSKLTAACNVTVSARAESLTFDVGKKTIGIGETFMLVPVVKPEGASPRLTWKSSDPAVAYVDANGRVEGFKTGTADITATTTDGSNLTATCRVTVIKYVSSISLSESEISLFAGETIKLTATVNPTDATNRKLAWTSTDEAVATVEDGTVTARGNGSATVVATSTDGSNIEAICHVTVTTPVSAIALSETQIEMRPGDFKVLTATVLPESASDKALTWTSSAPAVADVQNGIVLAYSNGTALVTAAATDGSGTTATCKVTVSNTVGIDGVQAAPQVAVNGRHITIQGIAAGTVCKIYRSNGTEVYSGTARDGRLTYTAKADGVYIVATGNRSCKVLVGGNK